VVVVSCCWSVVIFVFNDGFGVGFELGTHGFWLELEGIVFVYGYVDWFSVGELDEFRIVRVVGIRENYLIASFEECCEE